MEFKVRDEIVYLGTKEGKVDSDWEHYFGQYGIKKGSKGVIHEITEDRIGFFIRDEYRVITSGRLIECDIVLARDYKPIPGKTPTHLVLWDEENKDPHRFFTSEPKDFMKELSEKSEVVQDSVILVAIKSVQKISITKLVRFKNYKI